VLWANLFMLFWMSLAPWVIRWLDESDFAPMPVAAYGIVFLLTSIGYLWTQARIIRINGRNSVVGRAVGSDLKGKLSLAGYAMGAALAFVLPWLAIALYLVITLSWLIPDRRIEDELSKRL